jgi:hypothetical protein
MLNDIANITIMPHKNIKRPKQEQNKYTKSDALRNVYRAKVHTLINKRGNNG